MLRCCGWLPHVFWMISRVWSFRKVIAHLDTYTVRFMSVVQMVQDLCADIWHLPAQPNIMLQLLKCSRSGLSSPCAASLRKRRPNSSPEEVKWMLLWQMISLRPPPHHQEVNIICSEPVFWWVDNNSHHKTKWNSMGEGGANYSAFPASDTHSNRDKCQRAYEPAYHKYFHLLTCPQQRILHDNPKTS